MSPGSRLQPIPTDESDTASQPTAADLDFHVSDGWIYRSTKRSFDILVALLGLTLLLPLLPVIIVLIKLDSPGGVLFAQKRVGRNGRLFTCYKFRSMVANAEAMKADLVELNEASGAAFKIRQDPRITEIGAFLRKSSLDEMPQLLNVLRGDMSIVGPRPQIPAEVELYAPWHRRRLEGQTRNHLSVADLRPQPCGIRRMDASRRRIRAPPQHPAGCVDPAAHASGSDRPQGRLLNKGIEESRVRELLQIREATVQTRG